MLDFNGTLRFGGNKYFSAILNGMGAINDVVGKDVFNTDINLDMASAFFYVSLNGIEMGSSSDIDVGSFHIDGDINGSLSTKGFSLNMETNSDFVIGEDIHLGSSHLKINASSDAGLTFDGNMKMPFNLGNASVKGKITNGKVSFSGTLQAGAQLSLPNGMTLPTANMTVSFDETNGFLLEGDVRVPYIGNASIRGDIYSDGFSFTGTVSAGGIKFGSVTLPGKDGFKRFLGATITASKISLTGEGEIAGQTVGVDLTPDWGNKSLKACFNFVGNHCITF